MNKTKKTTLLSILTALAIVLSYVEMLLPPIMPTIPGIKIGLANIIAILLLYDFSFKDALMVSIIRVLIVSVLFGSILTLAYSLTGAVLSLIIMLLFKKINRFSTVGVSIAGGITHNLGQIIIAIFLTKSLQIGYYSIILIITGTLSGALIGLLGSLVLNFHKKTKVK